MMLMIIRLGGENGGELVHTVVHNNHNQPEVRFIIDPGHNHNHNHNQPEVRFLFDHGPIVLLASLVPKSQTMLTVR